MSLKSNILWSYISKYSGVILQFGSSLFLARLLTPSEIGTYSVALSLIGFAYLVRDFGLGEYLVQEKELTQEKTRTVYTLGLLLSVSLWGIVFLSADIIASFYQQPELELVVQIISLNFLIIPFNSPILALLRRNMQFKQRTYVEVASSAIFAIVAVSLAYNNYGVLSLAVASLATNVASFFICQLIKPTGFSYSPLLKNTKNIVHYCGFSSGAQFIRHAGTSAPDLIIGKILGMSAVGFFNRGSSLLQMLHRTLIEGLRPVLMPYFSQVQRNGENPANAYIMMLTVTLAIIWPCYFFILFEASTLIILFFGDQWLVSIPILQLMCIAAAINNMVIFTDELFKATGKVKSFLFIESIMTPLRVLSVIIGAQFSLSMVVLLLTALHILRVVMTNVIMLRCFDINIYRYVYMLLKNIGVLLFCGIPIFIINYFYIIESIYLKLIMNSILMLIFWLFGMFIFHPEISKNTCQFIIKKLFKRPTDQNP